MVKDNKKITPEITFIDTCDLCGMKKVQCRNHHLIPRRLINIIHPKKMRYWKLQVVKACDRCNLFLHPENKMYGQIRALQYEIATLKRIVTALKENSSDVWVNVTTNELCYKQLILCELNNIRKEE